MVLWPHTNTCLRLSFSGFVPSLCYTASSLVNPIVHLRPGPLRQVVFLVDQSSQSFDPLQSSEECSNPSTQRCPSQQANSGQFPMDQRALVWKYPLCLDQTHLSVFRVWYVVVLVSLCSVGLSLEYPSLECEMPQNGLNLRHNHSNKEWIVRVLPLMAVMHAPRSSHSVLMD